MANETPDEKPDLKTDLISQAEQLLTGLSASDRDKLKGDFQLIKEIAQAVSDAHPPSILLIGEPGAPLGEILSQLAPLSDPPEQWNIHQEIGRGRWQNWKLELGEFRVCDARSESPHESLPKALNFELPELILSVVSSNTRAPGRVEELQMVVEGVEDLANRLPSGALVIWRPSAGREVGDFVTLQALKEAFVDQGMARDAFPVVQLARPGKLLSSALAQLNESQRLGLARICGDPTSKKEIAQAIVRTATSVNASIAVVPIPVASSLPITTVQVLMISSIAWLSGREVNAKTLGEFGGALGLNIGAALALREFARALINWIPVAGSVVSAAIAAAATQTLGKAAIRYYIDKE